MGKKLRTLLSIDAGTENRMPGQGVIELPCYGGRDIFDGTVEQESRLCMGTGKQDDASAAGQTRTAVETSKQLSFLSAHVIGINHSLDGSCHSLGKRLDSGNNMNISLKKIGLIMSDNTVF